MNYIRTQCPSWIATKRTLVALIISSLYLIQPTAAQQSMDVEGLSKLTFEKLMQVRITGSTLTPEGLRTVPSAVTVFSHQEIKRLGLETLDELMNLIPGFQSYRSSFSSMAYTYSSRARRIGDPSSEILVLVDGQRLEEPGTGGSAQIVPKFPLMQVQRVEFIRGPGAAIYGSNAMMGVINIVTRSDANEVCASFGNLNRWRTYLLASRTIGGVAVDLFGHIEADKGDVYRLPDTFGDGRIDTDDPRELADLNVKLRWQDTRINLQHNQFKSENFYEADFVSNDFNQRSAQLSSISLKQGFVWRSVESWLRLSYNRTKFNISGQITAPGDLAPISEPTSNDAMIFSADFDDYSEARFQWHNNWDVNSKSSLQFGAELRHIHVPESIAKNNFDLGDLANGRYPIRYYGSLRATTPIQAESNRDVVGVYGQYRCREFESTHLTLGLRYDDFSGIGSQLSPRLGIVQELNNQHSLKLLYAKAFRAPAETELNLVNNPVLLGNPDLKPETVQSWELIWVGQWAHTSVSLGYFDNRFGDPIVRVSIGDGLGQFKNVNQDPTKGVEFELSREINEHWLLRATYTYISEKPDLSFREADQLASLVVNYNHSGWNVNLFTTYHGKREMATGSSDSNLISLDEYWQVFGKLRYHFNPNWQGFVQVKNLFDESYLTPASGSGLTEGIPNRGRELSAGIIWYR